MVDKMTDFSKYIELLESFGLAETKDYTVETTDLIFVQVPSVCGESHSELCFDKQGKFVRLVK
jgi:hypothetical protein